MNVRRTFITATLLHLSMGFSTVVQAANCDVDADGDVDRQDLSLILGARKTPATEADDPRDADGDGTITVNDARSCVKQCTLPRCTTVTPPADVSSSQVDGPKTVPVQETVEGAGKTNLTAAEKSATDTQRGSIVGGKTWQVKRGDTLYGIGRAVYPGDARKQARLRQDIVALNPSIFAKGANNMAIGVILRLPDYVAANGAPAKAGESTYEPAPAPVKPAPEPTPRPVTPAIVVQKEPETPPEPAAPAADGTVKSGQVKKEPSIVEEQSVSARSNLEGAVLFSLGFSYGGDTLVETDGPLDITAGSGIHLRLGYEQMPQHGSGYRIALGLQYSRTYEQDDDASLEDTYLQLAYQYRSNPYIYGIGIVSHAGAEVENDDVTTDYDSANGVVVYLEDVGDSKLAGWGLSYTFLDIEEEGSSSSVDASRLELYYNWRL